MWVGLIHGHLPHVSIIDSLVIGSSSMAVVENRGIVSTVKHKITRRSPIFPWVWMEFEPNNKESWLEGLYTNFNTDHLVLRLLGVFAARITLTEPTVVFYMYGKPAEVKGVWSHVTEVRRKTLLRDSSIWKFISETSCMLWGCTWKAGLWTEETCPEEDPEHISDEACSSEKWGVDFKEAESLPCQSYAHLKSDINSTSPRAHCYSADGNCECVCVSPSSPEGLREDETLPSTDACVGDVTHSPAREAVVLEHTAT